MKKLLFILLTTTQLFAVRGFVKGGFVAHENTEDTECTAQSTSATLVNCATIPLPENSGYKIVAECTGVRSDNAEFASIDKCALVSRAAGSASVEGSVVVTFDQPGTSGWDTQLNVSGNNATVEVKSPSETVNWSCRVRMVKKL